MRVVIPRLGTVRVRVATPPGFAPPDGVFLTFAGPRDEFHRRLNWSDEALEESVPAGRYDVIVSVAGLASAKRPADVRRGETLDLGEIALDVGVAATGRVVDAQGRGVAGAIVRVVGAGEETDPATKTDASGAFRLEHLPPEGEFIHVAAAGFVEFRTTRRHDARSAGDLVVTLLHGGVAKGRVVDRGGRLAAQDRLRVYVLGPITSAETGYGSFLDVDEQLGFHARVSAGRYRFALMSEDGVELATKEDDLREGEDTAVELVVEK
jgi:hypothetical protein